MKKSIAFLLAFVLVLSITACEVKEEPKPRETDAPDFTLPTEAKEATTIKKPDTIENDLDEQIEAEVEAVLDGLSAEYESIILGVDSYHTYMEKQGEIAAFYEKLNTASADICIKMCSYAFAYAQNILTSGKSTDEMYDDMEIVYDLIYDDMGDNIYDGIYDGILDDMYDALYDEALEDRPDNVAYAEWSNARSNEYERWSDTRSDTYEQWSDFRSDVYEFWSDMRRELWDDDLDGAWDEMEDFREDIERIKGKETSEPTKTEPTETTDDEFSANGIRPEFKEAMDSYEAFFDEYVAFMKAYMNSNNPISMMGEYTTMMQQYVKTMGQLTDINEKELSEEEVLYYTEVVLRINQKLLTID